MFTIDMINQNNFNNNEKSEGQTSVVVYKKGKPLINVIGGSLGETPLLNYVYNPETKTIHKSDIQFKQVCSPNSVCYKNKIYCLGGSLDMSNEDNLKLFKEEYNPIQNVSSILSFSRNMASCVNNDNLYFSGGYIKRETYCCYKYSFQKNTIEEIARLPLSSYSHSMVSLDNKLYIIGGCSNRLFGEMSLNNILVYDIEEDKWNIVNLDNDTIKSTPRQNHWSVVCENKIYSIGGIYKNIGQTCREPEDEEDYNTCTWHQLIEPILSVECFDPKTGILSYVAPLPYEMKDMTAVSVKMTKLMIRTEITSKPIYSELYNLLTRYVKDLWITDTIFEYIITEKIYVFKGQKVLSYIPAFNEWVEEIKF